MKPSSVTLAVLMTVGSAFAGMQALTPDETAKRQQVLSNVKQITLGTIMLSADSNDLFPTARSLAEVKKSVSPYVKSDVVWKNVRTDGGRIAYNANLSGVSSMALEAPGDTPLFYETKPWSDGKRVVGYADGHVKVEYDNRWKMVLPNIDKKWPKGKVGGGR